MPDLFSQRLSDHYDGARAEVRNFIAAIPCQNIETHGSVGYVASRTTDRLVLGVPSLNAEPIDRHTANNGDVAVYVHKVKNGSSLIYKPNPKNTGGWPHSIALDGDRIEISLRYEGNPGPRERHANIIERLNADILTLANEIQRKNAELLATIEPELAKRKAQCAEISRRESEL